MSSDYWRRSSAAIKGWETRRRNRAATNVDKLPTAVELSLLCEKIGKVFTPEKAVQYQDSTYRYWIDPWGKIIGYKGGHPHHWIGRQAASQYPKMRDMKDGGYEIPYKLGFVRASIWFDDQFVGSCGANQKITEPQFKAIAAMMTALQVRKPRTAFEFDLGLYDGPNIAKRNHTLGVTGIHDYQQFLMDIRPVKPPPLEVAHEATDAD